MGVSLNRRIYIASLGKVYASGTGEGEGRQVLSSMILCIANG